MEEVVFADGMYIDWIGKNHDKRPPNAPDFILGKFSFKAENFIRVLTSHVNEKGYVNVDYKRSKETGKPYLAVNTWKPKSQQGSQQPPVPQDTRDFSNGNPDDIPF